MVLQVRQTQTVEPGAIDVRCRHCKHYAMFHLDSGCTYRPSGTADSAPAMCECDHPIDKIVKRRNVVA